MWKSLETQTLAELSKTLARDRTYWERLIEGRHRAENLLMAQKTLPRLAEVSFEMAKRIAKEKGKEKSKADFKGFANVELSVEEKAEMKEWIRNVEAVQVELDEMAASGYKCTFQKSEATGGYQATAFCMDAKSPNAGYILSAFAPHWYDALCALAYKHAIKCEGVWPVEDDAVGDVWG